jgi:hypothetical protein
MVVLVRFFQTKASSLPRILDWLPALPNVSAKGPSEDPKSSLIERLYHGFDHFRGWSTQKITSEIDHRAITFLKVSS